MRHHECSFMQERHAESTPLKTAESEWPFRSGVATESTQRHCPQQAAARQSGKEGRGGPNESRDGSTVVAPLHVACCRFDDCHAASPIRTSPVTGTIQASVNTRFVRHTARVRAAGSACATSTTHGAAQQSERRLRPVRNGSKQDARIAMGQREAARNRQDRRTRARHATWHARRGASQPKRPLGSCPERGSLVNGVRKEIRHALEHRKNEPLADSAPGLAAPPPHLFRTPFRHAYAGLRTCRRHERLPSQYAQPTLTQLVRRSHHRRRISLPRRHRHRPPIRLARESDGTYRIIPPSHASASSSCRRLLQFAADVRLGPGRIHKRDTSGEQRVSRYRPPSFNVLNVLPGRQSSRVLASAVGNQSAPLAPPAGRVPSSRRGGRWGSLIGCASRRLSY